HLGYVGCYGNDWVATPALDCLAAEGIVFDQHFADCPEPAGARRSWWTGRYTFSREGPGNSVSTSEGSRLESPLLGELLRIQGITTVLVAGTHTVPFLTPGSWDHVEPPPITEEGTGMEQTLDAVTAALDRLASVEHWLLWVELPSLFPPWEVPEEF